MGICSDLLQDKFLETQILVLTQHLKERQCPALVGKLICAHYDNIYRRKPPDADCRVRFSWWEKKGRRPPGPHCGHAKGQICREKRGPFSFIQGLLLPLSIGLAASMACLYIWFWCWYAVNCMYRDGAQRARKLFEGMANARHLLVQWGGWARGSGSHI